MFESEVNQGNIQKADLVVCIPSYNEADSISFPTQMASEGLVKYFPDKNSVIINCDNNSPDNTKRAFLDTPTEVPKIHISNMTTKRREPTFWALQVPGWVLLAYLVYTQGITAISYDLGVAMGTQKSARHFGTGSRSVTC